MYDFDRLFSDNKDCLKNNWELVGKKIFYLFQEKQPLAHITNISIQESEDLLQKGFYKEFYLLIEMKFS